jgi:hypothetical protein
MSIATSTARQGDHRQKVATAGRRAGLGDRQLVDGTVTRILPDDAQRATA